MKYMYEAYVQNENADNEFRKLGLFRAPAEARKFFKEIYDRRSWTLVTKKVAVKRGWVRA